MYLVLFFSYYDEYQIDALPLTDLQLSDEAFKLAPFRSQQQLIQR